MTDATMKKIESTEDLRDGAFSETFEFTDIHGELRSMPIPRTLLSNPRKVLDMLFGKGLPPAPGLLSRLTRVIESSAPLHRKLPRGFGWADDRTYVLPHGIIGGGTNASVQWGQPSFQPQTYALPRGRSGDVGSWLAGVAWDCALSSVGTAAMCAGFGAVLNKWVDGPSFTINLYGPSKSGKSTMLLAAASVSGIGQERDLPNFNGTTSAMSELFALYNDQMLPANELGLVSGGRAQVYPLVRDFVYAVGEGRARTKNAKSPYADTAVAGQFRTIAVLTAERSVQQYAEDAGAERDGGEFARTFDLAVRRGPRQSIFDLALPCEQTDEVVAAKCQSIRDNASRYHGVALPEFIGHLLSYGVALPDRIRTLQNGFVASIDQKELPDAAWRHACRNFSILFAGGVLAREAWLLPVEPNDLRQILGDVFRDAARAQRHAKNQLIVCPPVENPSAILSDTLLRLKREGALVEHVSGSAVGYGSAGYWNRFANRIVYTVHTASLRRALGSDERRDAILLFLRDRKAIIIGQKSSKALKGSLAKQCTSWAQWPNGEKFRAFKFIRRANQIV